MCSTLSSGDAKKVSKGAWEMERIIESVLYIDFQASPPAGHCPCCGGECYAPGLRCVRCERDAP